jgi:hypothetical protein
MLELPPSPGTLEQPTATNTRTMMHKILSIIADLRIAKIRGVELLVLFFWIRPWIQNKN